MPPGFMSHMKAANGLVFLFSEDIALYIRIERHIKSNIKM